MNELIITLHWITLDYHIYREQTTMVMKGGKKRALSPAKEGEAATIEEVPLTRSVSTC